VYQGLTPTKFGRVASPAPLRLHRLHVPGPAPLKEVMHDIPIPVLDQEDLHKQGIFLIHASTLDCLSAYADYKTVVI
jgi:hypothetical protein